MKHNRIEIYDLKSDKFKTKTVNVFFCDTLDEQTASHNSLITSVLKRGTANYKTQRDITIRCQELYSTKIITDVDKKGETQVMRFTAVSIDEKYTKDQENVFHQSIDLLFDIITSPLIENERFKSEYLESEKVNICDLIESKINDKEYYAMYRCFQEMCKDEPYSVDEYGKCEIIEQISNAELFEYYQNVFLKKLPIKIFITGNITDNDISYVATKFKQLDKVDSEQLDNTNVFGSRHSKLGCPISMSAPEPCCVQHVTESLNVIQGKLCIGFRTGITAASEDYHVLSVFNLIFGGGTESKLFQQVRQNESMAYYIFSRLDKFKGLMIVSGGIEAESKDKALQLIFRELDAIRNGDISDEELEAAINTYVDAVKQLQDGQSTLSDFYLGQILCGVTAVSFDEMIEKVKSVTKEQVAAMAEKVICDTIYFLEPEGSGKEIYV